CGGARARAMEGLATPVPSCSATAANGCFSPTLAGQLWAGRPWPGPAVAGRRRRCTRSECWSSPPA
ncbi:MAG: hypothetical protein AVDCRST_MAG64-861, partial [uncultured Phycisphaerae bacterium]